MIQDSRKEKVGQGGQSGGCPENSAKSGGLNGGGPFALKPGCERCLSEEGEEETFGVDLLSRYATDYKLAVYLRKIYS